MLTATDLKQIAKTLVNLFLDYVRWTQLVPMVFGWIFAVVMILALLLIGLQGEINSLLEKAEPYAVQFFGDAPEAPIDGEISAESSSVQITEDGIVTWIYRIWGVLAFIGLLINIIRTKLFGPKPQKGLRRKIAIAGIGAISYVILLFLGYMLIGDFSGNTLIELTVPFILLPFLLFIISVWGLSVSHIINKLQLFLDELLIEENSIDPMVKRTT